ncbi:hypothetical protein ES703_31959 [subsurface metagenome]
MGRAMKLAGVESIALEAIQVDGGHHKQWYLEKILELCGWDSEQLQKIYPHEEGIAP